MWNFFLKEFLMKKKNVEIQFAYRTFVWTSEAKNRAAVHCVIIGFTCYETKTMKQLFEKEQWSS